MKKRLRGFGFIRKRPNGGWQISYSVRGQEIRESVAKALNRRPDQCTEKDARDLLAQRLGEIQGGTYVAHRWRFSLHAALDNYLAHLQLARAKSYRQIRSGVNGIKRQIPDMPARDLTAPMIAAWAKKMLATQKPGTVRLRCDLLKAALNRAHREQMLAIVPVFPQIRVNNARQGFFERDEFEKVVALLPDPLNDLARFGYYTGWRHGEILALTWAQVDRRRREIRLMDTKNGEGRILPLVGELWPLIERRWAARVVNSALIPWVFHRYHGKPVKNFRWQWRKACRAAGVQRIFHDFRRTAARDLVEAGNDYRAAMTVTGHRSLSVFMRYRITDPGTTARALERMEAHRAEQNTAISLPVRRSNG